MSTKALLNRAGQLLSLCREKQVKIVTAESCTGGLIAELLTEIPGSSDVFERGFITYSYESKTELLDVPQAMLLKHGAVSAEVAKAMAMGALAHSHGDIAVAVTGIAGPGGGTPQKPVGTVFIATASRKTKRAEAVRWSFTGKRSMVRSKSAGKALSMLKELLASL